MISPRDPRIVLITGAGAGIGLATAHAFAAQGDVVVLTDRDVDAVARAATALGAPHVGLVMDVTDDGAVTHAFADVVARFGRIDVLVNNAAIIDPAASPLIDIPTDTIRALLSVNVEGAHRVARVAAWVMTAQGGGAIVNLASGAALIGNANRATYATSKAAVIGMTRALAHECRGAGVRVNAVLPGYVATEMLQSLQRSGATDFAVIAAKIPLGRLADPVEVAGAILHLAGARHIHGASLVVDGGTTVHGGAGVASTTPAPIRPIEPGQVVVVIGGADGIGAAIADRFVAQGDDVVVIDRDAAAIARLPADRSGLVADHADEVALLAAFAIVAGRHGALAVLINAASAPDAITADLLGTMLASRIAVTTMRGAGGGAIVNLIARADGSDVAFAAIGAGIVTLTRNLACEWAAYGIRVNAVAPGRDDVTDTIAFLASPAARYITGIELICDGGASMI